MRHHAAMSAAPPPPADAGAKKPGGKKKLLIPLVAVLVLVGIGAGGWFSGIIPKLLGKGGETTEADAGHGPAAAHGAPAAAAPAAAAHGAPAAHGAKAEAKPAVAEAAESEAAKASLDEAVSKATGTTGDRLARLREALHAAGRSADRVRLVRVFGGEDVVAGAKKIGEHQFLVDLMPASMKQVFKDPKDEKKSFGPKRPSGSTKNKSDASLEGSFSMDTVAQDRKSERGAPGSKRPGGPGGPAGARPGGNRGGRPGGNGPPRGGRTSGAPKP